MNLSEEISQTERDLGLALLTAKVCELTNAVRIRTLRTRLERLRLERDALFRAELDLMLEFERRQGVTRVGPSALVALGMDEVPGVGRDNGWLLEEGKRVRRL